MRLSVIAVIALALGALVGTSRTAQAEPRTPAMLVEWHGSWWAAHPIGRTNDGRTAVHYDGWGPEWDEIVPPSRIAHATDDGKLFVSWGGSWWAATIVRQEKGGALHVHYDGWGAEWDETVDATRVIHLAR